MIVLMYYQKTALKIVFAFWGIGLFWFVLFNTIVPELLSYQFPTSLVWLGFLLIASFYLYKALSLPLKKSEQMSRALQYNEKKYRTLVEEINEVIFVIDSMGKITYISPSVTMLTGYQPKEMIGRLFLEFIAPEDEDKVYNAFKERMRGQIAPMQYRILNKDGSKRWVRSLSKPYRGENGNTGIRGVLMDITDLIEKDLALVESEARWRALVEQAPDYIITTDISGKVEFVNRNFFEIPEEHIIGQMIFDLAPSNEMPKIKKVIKEVVSKGTLQRFEIEFKVGEEKRWYLVRSGPIKKNSKIVGLTFIATDITRNRQYQQELQEIRSRLENLLSERTLELKSANREMKTMDDLISKKLSEFRMALDHFIEQVTQCANQTQSPNLTTLQNEAKQLKANFSEISSAIKQRKKVKSGRKKSKST